MISEKEAKKALDSMLSMPINKTLPILKKFAKLPRASARLEGDKYDFVYVHGTREDRVLLIAHADTVWDAVYTAKKRILKRKRRPKIGYENGVYFSKDPSCGIGADDRAGCAILWLLRQSGHSLLITDGEERGELACKYMKEHYPGTFDLLNSNAYMIQADRRNASDYKCYNIPVTDEFRRFVEENTGFTDAGNTAATDIVVLCDKICGVNLSVGYHNEHTPGETLVFDEWYNSLCVIEKMITAPQKRYEL
ncbi:MAG: hypothetical protein II777_01670 [Clostridia bacterium]|nr:hypothetical protein [Clostridia bacterium]